MRKHVVGLICLLFSALPVAADPLNDALILYEGGHYAEAIPLLGPLADGGAIDAQLALFNIYNFGFGVAVDQATAIRWLSRAAKGGNPDALYNLGAMTLEGRGTTADPAKAVQLLHRAAELESPDAFYLLAALSIQEAPITGDIDTGLGYLTRAAQLGQRGASAMLAVLLQEIPEVEHHLVKSAFHFQIAIDRGCNDLADEAAQAMARLSPDERALYDRSFAPILATSQAAPTGRNMDDGPCLAQ